MKTIAVICEYNLFHNGHLRQIGYIRKFMKDAGEQFAVIALMSGNYVQRGELAILPKYERALAAVLNGANLVLELPYPYSCSSAEYFAQGAVRIINSLNIVDYLCFGSESGDIAYLEHIARATASDEYLSEVKKLRATYRSSPVSDIKLREQAYQNIYGQTHMLKPNDMLGVEYLRSLHTSQGTAAPLVVKRTGSETATAARKYYKSRLYDDLNAIVPASAFEIYRKYTPVNSETLSAAMLAILRLADPSELVAYDGVTTGLANRLCAGADQAVTLEELYAICATKKYTNAKIRRTVLNCVFGTTTAMLKEKPAHTSVLAADEIGTKLLSSIKKSSDIIILTKTAHYKRQVENQVFARQFYHALKADKLYALAQKKSAGVFVRQSPYIVEKDKFNL